MNGKVCFGGGFLQEKYPGSLEYFALRNTPAVANAFFVIKVLIVYLVVFFFFPTVRVFWIRKIPD